jgi:hypothetical protein
LPEKIWLRVLQNLPVKDVNNVHLVCRNLYQIGNLHVNPKLCFEKKSTKDLKSLLKSSRIFEELKFTRGSDDYLKNQENFQPLEEYLVSIGPHVKTLIISRVLVDPLVFQKLLDFCPNLEALELDTVESTSEEPIKWSLKSPKIERFKIHSIDRKFEGLFEPLQKCTVKELDIKLSDELNVYSSVRTEEESEAIRNFLKSQEKNLKKLTGTNLDFDLPGDLKDLQLEYLDYMFYETEDDSLEFLEQFEDLKHLRLRLGNWSTENFNVICELKNLESLELTGIVGEGSNMNNLYKLGNLRRLRVYRGISWNILDHIKFGVFQNLEELHAAIGGASLESIQEMKRITPNLKKLLIHSRSLDTINDLLAALENLEAVKIKDSIQKIPEKFCPKLKRLEVSCSGDFKLTAKQILQNFPNLEFLRISVCSVKVKKSIFVGLLSGLKQLKTFYMGMWVVNELYPEPVLQWFQKYGRNLEDTHVAFGRREFKQWRSFFIEKRPGGSLCVKYEDNPNSEPWMKRIF